jgi:hypothetical protein
MARVGDVVLLDHPAETTGPRSINCYLVEVLYFTAAAPSGTSREFKIVPERLLYSLRWKHNGTPPDLRLQLVRDPRLWFDAVSLALLADLSKHAPELPERLRTARSTENGQDGRPAGRTCRAGS